MSDREAHVAANEAIYRELNEQIVDADPGESLLTIMCECGRISCSMPIEISMRRYEAVRSDPTLFVVVSGHEMQDVERVEDRMFHYAVVRKNEGVAADVAKRTDPRGDR